MEPLFWPHTKSTTVRRCSVELKGLSKVGTQDTLSLVFLICLMSWDGRLFLKEDRRLDLLFYKIMNGC